MWVKPWILQRVRYGAYNALINEFVLSEREDYRPFMRMNMETFHELMEAVRAPTLQSEKHLCETKQKNLPQHFDS